MQQVDDPPSLPVGTEVSAKYKGAFCEAKVSKVVRNIKVKVAYKQGLGSGIVSDDAIKAAPGQLRVGAVVEVRHPERKEYVEATVTKIQDCSQYTVVFDDGDITTLRRTALCLKSGRHFNESETLDQLPLTHPEHFGNPVVGGRRGRRRGHTNDDSSEEEEEAEAKEIVNEKEENIGKIICVEIESKKKDKEKWFPGLVVAPTAQATVRIRVKDEYLVRSFKDGRYYTVPKKEASEFTREAAMKQDSPAVQAALEYLDSDVLPPHWDRDELFGLSNTTSDEEAEVDSDSSDDEPHEEKDLFVAQLYKYMDDRGTPLNKMPSIQSRDVDLYRLFRAVQKRGGYNRVTAQNQWKPIALRLGFTPVTVSVANLVKQAYKKFLQPYCEFHRKLGCSMIMTSRNTNRSKGRSLVRANSVASPKPVDASKEAVTQPKPTTSSLASTSSTSSASATAQHGTGTTTTPVSTISTSGASMIMASQSNSDESENTSESSNDNSKNKRKTSLSSSKVKGLIEKYEEKTATKDEGDVPLSKIKAAAANSRAEEKDKEKEKEREKEREREKEKEKDKEKEKEKEREREKEKEKNIEKDSTKDLINSTMSTARETSPMANSSSSTLIRKEKLQKKQTLQTQPEEKRGKRKRDESTVEKVDTGDFVVELGDKLKVYYHEKKVTYEAKVIEIAVQKGTPMYLVHYTGWNNRYDEWVPRERIAENLTKGSKQKGRTSSTEKQRENPPKPPSAMSLSSPSGVVGASSANVSPTGSVILSTKTPTGAKRGRGRSSLCLSDGMSKKGQADWEMPPRSTTPSSIASNSSRTKSPATASSSFKKRPTRVQANSARRISANISDISVPTDTDSDSDEPVRRPTRASKETHFKSAGSTGSSGKTPTKGKRSISAANSQSDDSDDDDDDDVNAKGRDYDLNQIRSELKGFQGLKSPSQTTSQNKDSGNTADVKSDLSSAIKIEPDFEKSNISSGPNQGITIKKDAKVEPQDEPAKSSSTDVSSETDSFGDDDSQSSDKTTILENMTKKFQQKIHADKQRATEKQPIAKTRIVEKIIKDTLAEKRQESLKSKPTIKEEHKSIKTESDSKYFMEESEKKTANVASQEDEKKLSTLSSDIKPNTSGQTGRFTAGTASGVNSKFTSVIVEKPQPTTKKTDLSTVNVKKSEIGKRQTSETTGAILQTKKLGEITFKEILKAEPPAAGSPSSTSSTSSLGSSSSVASTTRSLPDMSKLDISGSSSASSAYATSTSRDTKFSAITSKPISPDIYEFKDPEPFEFEVRKSPMVSTPNPHTASGTLPSTSSHPSPTATRKQVQKASTSAFEREQGSSINVTNPMAGLVNRKKRGSPLKDTSAVEHKAKHAKGEEKLSPLVADAKLVHPAPATLVLAHSTSTTNMLAGTSAPATPVTIMKNATATLSKVITANPTAPCAVGMHVNMLAPPPPLSIKVDAHAPNPQSNFDALRKSPSFNLNINALNEELAQTLQETTRALTDATQPPGTPTTPPVVKEVTPIKVESSKQKNPSNMPSPTAATVPKQSTPPNAPSTTAKITVGSPFIETRRDLSNVFELSNPGSSTNNETKDNKFELENVKILLSASVGAFDLEPSKYESKPTSIADKVLKAISQKKEEVENKGKEKEDEALSTAATIKTSMESFPSPGAVISDSVRSNLSPPSLSFEKKDAPTVGSSLDKLLPTSANTTAAVTPLFKATTRTSPEPKLGLLESIAVKNNDLSETIQKLECAIQRKTPVGGLSLSSSVLPSPTVGQPTNFSEDSGDSTDSERRLVIEDVNEEANDGQKVAENKLGIPTIKLDSAKNQAEHSIAMQAPIPLKVVASPQRLTARLSTSPVATAIIMTEKSANSSTTHSPDQMITAALLKQNQQGVQFKPGGDAFIASEKSTQPTAVGNAGAVPCQSMKASQTQQATVQNVQRGSAGVPVVVPEIPVSVLVASNAVPLVMAAAQAAAASFHHPKLSESELSTAAPAPIQQTGGKLVSTNISQTPMQATLTAAVAAAIPKHFINTKSISTPRSAYNLPKSSSGFYLDPRTDLRPDDGVKPISELSLQLGDQTTSLAATTNPTATIEIHSDSINLLCEETIPGSPAPAFGGKEESSSSSQNFIVQHQQQPQQQQPQQIRPTVIGDNKINLSTTGSNIALIPAIASTMLNPATQNSSPNDSQEDSSEELKKTMDNESEVAPRKRRRTRKQLEIISASSAVTEQQQQFKRRRVLTCTKKSNNAGASDSDDNSVISQPSITSTRQSQLQQQQHNQPCPYNFLVQLDPSLSPDQCIPILLKQIQDLRKTYNMIKSDLASIDRRRKKLRRREREKKQQLQNQQQIKINS